MADEPQPKPVILPQDPPPSNGLSTKQKAAAIAAACALCVPLTASFEGLRTHPYKDVTGTSTVCYGDTQVPMRVYSSDQCGAFLRRKLARAYAPYLLRCVPEFIEPEHKRAFAALLDASYNAGWPAACKSRMAAAFNRGLWRTACDGFPGWYTTSKGRPLAVLVRRRGAERYLCITGIAKLN